MRLTFSGGRCGAVPEGVAQPREQAETNDSGYQHGPNLGIGVRAVKGGREPWLGR